MAVDEALIQSVVQEVRYFPKDDKKFVLMGDYSADDEDAYRIDNRFLLCSLGVLTADMRDFLSRVEVEGSEGFKAVLDELADEEDPQYRGFFSDPIYPYEMKRRKLPTGMAAQAAWGSPTLVPLADPDIIHEWTEDAGRRAYNKILERYWENLKKAICGKGKEWFEKIQDLVADAQIAAIAGAIIAGVFTFGVLAVPIAILLAMLLISAGLDTLCDFKSNDN